MLVLLQFSDPISQITKLDDVYLLVARALYWSCIPISYDPNVHAQDSRRESLERTSLLRVKSFSTIVYSK